MKNRIIILLLFGLVCFSSVAGENKGIEMDSDSLGFKAAALIDLHYGTVFSEYIHEPHRMLDLRTEPNDTVCAFFFSSIALSGIYNYVIESNSDRITFLTSEYGYNGIDGIDSMIKTNAYREVKGRELVDRHDFYPEPIYACRFIIHDNRIASWDFYYYYE